MTLPEPPTLGEMLRTARLDRGLDLADLANSTRIPAAHLDALERGQWAALPDRVYQRGFLRILARSLELDAADVLSRHDLETRSPPPRRGRDARAHPLRVGPAGATLIRPGRIFGGLLAVLALGVVVYLAAELAIFARIPELRITDPAADLASYPGADYLVRGVTAPNARVQVDGLRANPAVTAGADGRFAVRVTLVPGANVITLVAADPLTGRDSEPVHRTIVVVPR
ncbi:MAG TPA: helix-turn-helix domain-containing protein [Candidatus Limnocylindria bacterium]|nr:helix-turn-helix domain-containing protein [Candidatus Limnocylindria bacterium]